MPFEPVIQWLATDDWDPERIQGLYRGSSLGVPFVRVSWHLRIHVFGAMAPSPATSGNHGSSSKVAYLAASVAGDAVVVGGVDFAWKAVEAGDGEAVAPEVGDNPSKSQSGAQHR